MKVRDLIRLLESNGWRLKRTKGSHLHFRHPEEEAEGFTTYTVIYEQGPTSWGAYVPDLPGVITVGDARKK